MRLSPHFSRRSIGDTLLWAWRSPRLFAMVLLAVAVILGAHYRFHRLDRWDMNGDEGCTWAAVIMPNVCGVVGRFWQVE